MIPCGRRTTTKRNVYSTQGQDSKATNSEPVIQRHCQPWWQLAAPNKQLLATANFITAPRQQLPVTDDELRSLTPCEVVRDALPAKLANSLLRTLLLDAATWTRGTWYMGGKEHVAPRSSAYYTLNDTQVCEHSIHFDKRLLCDGAAYSTRYLLLMRMQEVKDAAEFNEDAIDVSSTVNTQTASSELQEAATTVSDHVNRLAERVQSSLASSDRSALILITCCSVIR